MPRIDPKIKKKKRVNFKEKIELKNTIPKIEINLRNTFFILKI